MRTYEGIARRLGLDEATVRAVAEELEVCGYRLEKRRSVTAHMVRSIRERHARGEGIRSIMVDTGLQWSAIDNIVRRKTWRHVK